MEGESHVVNELVNALKEAEYVLVGIGEEFQIPYENIIQEERYQKMMEQIKNQEKYEWVTSYLIHDYLRTTSFPKWQEAYQKLAEILQDKDYFVVSTCTDDLIYEAPFAENRIVTPCGTFYKMQCEDCCGAMVEYGEQVAKMVTKDLLQCQGNFESVERPRCEKCNAPFVFNTVFEPKYDETGYQSDWNRYSQWLQKTVNRKLVILELGVGLVYPSVIRLPFEKTSYFNKKSHFYRINHGIYQLSEKSESRGFGLKQDVFAFIQCLHREMKK